MRRSIMSSGLSREEIIENSETMRMKIFTHLNENGKLCIRELAEHFEVSRDQIRCYVKQLITNKNVYAVTLNKSTYYVVTGLPYTSTFTKKLSTKNTNPYARLVRLENKHPPKAADTGKRKLNPYRSTSMAMFETN